MYQPGSFVSWLIRLLICWGMISFLAPLCFSQNSGLRDLVEGKKSTASPEEKTDNPEKLKEGIVVLKEKVTTATDAYEVRKKELTPLIAQAKETVRKVTLELERATSPEEIKMLEEEVKLARDWEQTLEKQVALAREEVSLVEGMLQMEEKRAALPKEKLKLEEQLEKGSAFTPEEAEIALKEAKVAAENYALAQGKVAALEKDLFSLEKEATQAKLAAAKGEQELKNLMETVTTQEEGYEKVQLDRQVRIGKQRVELLKARAELADKQVELAKGNYELARQEMELLKEQSELQNHWAAAIRESAGFSEEILKAQQEKAAEVQKTAEIEKQQAQQEREKAQKAIEQAKASKEQATTSEEVILAELRQRAAEMRAKLAEMKADLARIKIETAEKKVKIAQKKAEISARKLEVERGTLTAMEYLINYEQAKAEAVKAAEEAQSARLRANLARQEAETFKGEAELAELKVQVERSRVSELPGSQQTFEVVPTLEEIAQLAQERAQIAEERATILHEFAQLATENAQISENLEQIMAIRRIKLNLWRREESKISWVILEEVHTDLVNARSTLLIWMSNLPGQLIVLKNYLLEPSRLQKMIYQGGIITFVFPVAILCVILLRRGLRRIITKQESFYPPPTAWKKILRAGTRIFYNTLFPAILLLAGLLTLYLTTAAKKTMLAGVLVLAGLTAYQLIKSVLQELFMPWDSLQRLISCRDSIASYMYRRLLWMTFYATFLSTIIFILEAVEYHEGVISFLWLVFRLGFFALLILLTYNKEAIISFLPEAKNRLEKTIYLAIARIYPLFVLFIITIITLQSLGYINLARFLITSSLMTILILAIAHLVDKGIDKFLKWWFFSADRIERDFLFDQETSKTLYTVLNRFISYLISILAIFAIVGIWGVDLSGFYAALTSETSRNYFWRLLSIGLIILISIVTVRTAYYLIDKVFILSPEEARTWRKKIALGEKGKTIGPLLKSLIRYTVIFITGVLVLRKLGVDPTPIIAGAGVIGLAVGFGAQTLVKDVISGFFLLFEGAIAVGDVINFGDQGGLVEEVGLRVTKYRTFSGELWVIPNGEIRAFGNLNREWMRAVVPVSIAYEQDVGRAMRMVEEVGKTWAAERRDIVLEPPEVQGILSFDDSAIIIRLVIKVKPLQQWKAEWELKLRIKEAFDREGIEIPFPRRVVYTRQEEMGRYAEQRRLILSTKSPPEDNGTWKQKGNFEKKSG